MTTQTLTRLFDRHADAAATVQALEAAGFSHDDVSIVASNLDGSHPDSGNTAAATDASGTGAGTGATLGTVLGGGAGLLAGIGALAIPGVGPVVAAGWLVAALTGAGVGAAAAGAVGGIVGALTQAGVSEHDAHVYAEGVRRGGTLVTARVDSSRVTEAERILDNRTAVNPTARRTEYTQAGWNKFDPAAPAYVAPPSDGGLHATSTVTGDPIGSNRA